jgi:hypothetical protein
MRRIVPGLTVLVIVLFALWVYVDLREPLIVVRVEGTQVVLPSATLFVPTVTETIGLPRASVATPAPGRLFQHEPGRTDSRSP